MILEIVCRCRPAPDMTYACTDHKDGRSWAIDFRVGSVVFTVLLA